MEKQQENRGGSQGGLRGFHCCGFVAKTGRHSEKRQNPDNAETVVKERAAGRRVLQLRELFLHFVVEGPQFKRLGEEIIHGAYLSDLSFCDLRGEHDDGNVFGLLVAF